MDLRQGTLTPFHIVQNDDFLNLLNDYGNQEMNPAVMDQHNTQDDDYESLHNYINKNMYDPRGAIQERQWMFGSEPEFEMKFEDSPIQNPLYEPQQPPLMPRRDQRSDSFFGMQLLVSSLPQQQIVRHGSKSLKDSKEKDIIKNNQELFLANQSKSIYLSKISQLIDTTIQPKSQQTSPKSSTSGRIQEKLQRKTSGGKNDSDASSQEGNQQSKLAKNRESARNSRKRKKVYIELLENKVQELSEEISKLQQTCSNQKSYIEFCTKQVHLLQDFIQGYQMQLQQINSKLNTQQVQQELHELDVRYGVRSQPRALLCSNFFNNLIDYTIPMEVKKLVESAEKGYDFFQFQSLCSKEWSNEMQNQMYKIPQQVIQDLRGRILCESQKLEMQMHQFSVCYEMIKEQTGVLEDMKKEMIDILTPKLYAQYLISFDNQCSDVLSSIKQEEIDIKKQRKLQQ